MSDPAERVRAMTEASMQEELGKIVSDLHRFSSIQRQTAMLGAFADFIKYGSVKAAELEKAGYPEQAEELRARLAEMMPDAAAMPPLALPQPQPSSLPSTNGAPSLPITRRRGRPPKGSGNSPS